MNQDQRLLCSLTMTDATDADNASLGATYPPDEEPTRVGVHPQCNKALLETIFAALYMHDMQSTVDT